MSDTFASRFCLLWPRLGSWPHIEAIPLPLWLSTQQCYCLPHAGLVGVLLIIKYCNGKGSHRLSGPENFKILISLVKRLCGTLNAERLGWSRGCRARGTLGFPLALLPPHFPACWDKGPISQMSKVSPRKLNLTVGEQTSEPWFYIP